MMINKKQMWSDSPFNQWTEEELLCMKYQGICYGKGGGSAPPPPPATQTVRQSSEFPEELKPFVSDIFGKAQAIQEQRQEEGFRPELTQQLAAFTPDQQAAFTGIREQVGQTRPLFQEATNLARGATRAATDPAEVAALMNPFLRNVTDIEKREAQRVADVQEQQLAAQAAQAGAFGGSRAAILEAERQRNLAQQLGDIEARGRLAAFQDAQARLQNQFGREAAGAAQLSALGAAIPAQTFKELGALSGVGAAEQQQTQRALDIATQQAREEYGFPMQTLQDFQSILRGFPLPATTNVSRQTFSPAQPLSTQLLGLGTGLAGLAGAAGAFKKAGGLVGAPVAMKDGGYVKLAGGGGLGQLMQGKLPSNRVRMGKVAYQDVGYAASTIPPYGKLFGESLQDLTPEIIRLRKAGVTEDKLKKLADEIKLFKSRLEDSPNRQQSKRMIDNFTDQMKSKYGDAAVQATFTMAGLPFTTDAPKLDVAGNVATQSAQAAASGADVPKVPAPVSQLTGAAYNLQRSRERQQENPELSQRPTYSQTQPPLQTQPPFTPLSPEMEGFLRTIEREDTITDIDQEMADRGPLSFAARGLQIIPAVSGPVGTPLRYLRQQVPTFREAEHAGTVGSGEIPQRFITPAEGDFPASLAAPSLVSAPPPLPLPPAAPSGPKAEEIVDYGGRIADIAEGTGLTQEEVRRRYSAIPQERVIPAEGDFPASLLAAPSLVSAPTAAPPRPTAEEVVTSPAAGPSQSLRQSIRERFPFRIGAPTTQYTPPPPAPPIPSAELRSNAATGNFSPAEGYTAKARKALEKYNVPFERRGVRPELGDMPVQTEKLGFSPETTEDVRSFLGGTPEGRNPAQRLLNTIGVDRTFTEGLDFLATGADAARKAVGSLAGVGEYLTTPNFQSVPDADVLAAREKLIAEGKGTEPADIGNPDAGPKDATGGMFPDDPNVTSIQELEKAQAEAQANADAVRTREKAKAATGPTDDGGAAGDVSVDAMKNISAPVEQAKGALADQIAAIDKTKIGKDIKDALGPVPQFKKPDEPDFAARNWLALAKAGFAIASTPGTEGVGKALANGGKAAVAELTEIAKDKKKFLEKIRETDNKQLQINYNDKVNRYNLLETAYAKEVDNLIKSADLAAKVKNNQIREKTANAQVAMLSSQNANLNLDMMKTQMQIDEDSKGQLGIGKLQKVIEDNLLKAKASRNSLNAMFPSLSTSMAADANLKIALEGSLSVLRGRKASLQNNSLAVYRTVKGPQGKETRQSAAKELDQLIAQYQKELNNLGATPKGSDNRTFQARRGQDGKLIQ